MRLAQEPQRSEAGEAPTHWVSVSGWHDCRKHSEIEHKSNGFSIPLRKLIPPVLKLRMCNEKLIFLFLNQNICCGYSKEPSHRGGSFEHPKHMLRLKGKKIFTILD